MATPLHTSFFIFKPENAITKVEFSSTSGLQNYEEIFQ